MSVSIDNHEKIASMCESLIRSSHLRAKSTKVNILKQKERLKKIKPTHGEISELLKGLFETLPQDINCKVKCTDLMENLVSLGVTMEPLLLSNVFLDYLKVPKIQHAKITLEDFVSMIFTDRKSDILLEALKKHLITKKNSSALPIIRIKPISSISPLRFIKKSNISPILITNVQELKPEDYLNLLSTWWNEYDNEGNGFLHISKVVEMLIKKEIVKNYADGKRYFPSFEGNVLRAEFFAVFCVAVLKYQVLEIARKVNSLAISKPFLPSSQKLSSIKRRLLISRISPDSDDNVRSEGDRVVTGIARFHRYIRSIAPASYR